MQINNQIFNAELEDILVELQRQVHMNGYPYLQKDAKRSGNSLQIQCPYHSNGQERNRSAGIRIHDGMFHCFACNEIHTLPEVISHCLGHDEDTSGSWGWKWLLKNFAVVEVEERKDVALDFYRGNKRDSSNNLTSYIEEKELDRYRYIHPYMYKRRLTDEIIEMFDIGYDKNTKCITFPVRDIHGNCLFIARRSVKTKFFNYPEGVEKPLYGLYELSCIAGWYGNQLSKITGNGNVYVGLDWKENIDEVIVCESMLDALTCWVYGKYAVALNGLGNDLQFKQLRQLPVRKIILATDNDERGMQARKRIAKNVTNKLITQYVIPHIKRKDGKETKDINDLEYKEFTRLEEIL